MGTKPQISIIIPCYNERYRIPPVLREVRDYLDRYYPGRGEILVVDDGSTDDTAEFAAQVLGSGSVIRHARNEGKGAAVRTGMLQASGEMRLFMDADGATSIYEEKKLSRLIAAGSDVAIGSRASLQGTSKWTWRARESMPLLSSSSADRRTAVWEVYPHRQLLGRIFALAVRLRLGLDFNDTQCGFKMFRAEAARQIFSRLRTKRFAMDVEVLSLARELRLKVAETPVNWHEIAGSKLRLFRDSLAMFRGVAQIRAWERERASP